VLCSDCFPEDRTHIVGSGSTLVYTQDGIDQREGHILFLSVA
jgi:hypothetical protein